jgi:hypothetical protein
MAVLKRNRGIMYIGLYVKDKYEVGTGWRLKTRRKERNEHSWLTTLSLSTTVNSSVSSNRPAWDPMRRQDVNMYARDLEGGDYVLLNSIIPTMKLWKPRRNENDRSIRLHTSFQLFLKTHFQA